MRYEVMIGRIVLLLGCMSLLSLSWIAVINMRSPDDIQSELIVLADEEIRKDTHANAVEYLEEAVTYSTGQTFSAQQTLKRVYLRLDDTEKYAKLLKQQTASANCPASVYEEYALYCISQGRLNDALKALRLGIERTNDTSLRDFYEGQRYAFSVGREAYEDVTAFLSGGIQVKKDGLWGLANNSGRISIPCDYEQISTFDSANGGCVVALRHDRKLVTLNMRNHPIAISDIAIERIGNLSQDIIPLKPAGGKWIIANSKLASNNAEFEGIGAAANYAVAVMKSGKSGVMSLGGGTILPCEYDEVIMDELGRCYAQNAVFARSGGKVYLFVDGKPQPETYEDARPFPDNGWAAVKKHGKWGFIDSEGSVQVDFRFDDALSFGGHLAAVKQGGLWGYISLYGLIAIEPAFLDAKSFSNGTAPVLTEFGWQFITLFER